MGLTQQQLWKEALCNNKAVSSGNVASHFLTSSLLVPLCRVLGLTVQELLDEYSSKFGGSPAARPRKILRRTLFAAQQLCRYLYIDLKPPLRCRPICLAGFRSIPERSWMVLSAQMIRNRKFAGAAACNGVTGLGRHRRMRVLCQ